MDNLRLILSIALAFILFQLYQAWQADYGPQPTVVEQADAGQVIESNTSQQITEKSNEIPEVPAGNITVDSTDIPSVEKTKKISKASKKGIRVHVRTDLLDIEIDTAGGDIKSAGLVKYPVSLDMKDTPFKLMTDEGNSLFIAQSGLLGDVSAPDHHAEFIPVQTEYVLEDNATNLSVPMKWTSDDGTVVTKTYKFKRDSYIVEIEYTIDNPTDADWLGRTYTQFKRTEPEKTTSQQFMYTFTGAVLHSEVNRYDKLKFGDMKDEPVSRVETGGWVAMIQHYFGAAIISDAEDKNRFYAKSLNNGEYAAGIIAPVFRVNANSSNKTSVKIYIGPKEQSRLVKAAPGLELLVDYGVLTIIAEPIYWLMEKIQSVVINWGFSIIILTMLIKLAFYRLSAASYRSMANMRKLSPRMKQIKERYGDDRQKMNQAMMDMYKKEKINPLGGCLPIVVQIPVFISLYWVLLESVEMRQAPFILWIHDLSAYDPYFVLPVLMGITMVIQQKLNPAPMDPIQAKVMMILPIAFTVLFLFFPSGLVLYWFVNNTLSIIQQWVITKRIEAS